MCNLPSCLLTAMSVNYTPRSESSWSVKLLEIALEVTLFEVTMHLTHESTT